MTYNVYIKNDAVSIIDFEQSYQFVKNDDEEEIQIDEFVFDFTTKEDLVSGTYRLVYTLYDLEDVEVEEVDENGTVTGTYTETKYQYIS